MEIFVILLVGVMVLGPEHLPKLVRTLTRVMSDVRRVSTDFQRTINLEANAEEQKQAEAAMKKKRRKKTTPAKQPEASAPDTVDTAAAAPADKAEEEMPAVYAAPDTPAAVATADKAGEEASAADTVDAHGDKA